MGRRGEKEEIRKKDGKRERNARWMRKEQKKNELNSNTFFITRATQSISENMKGTPEFLIITNYTFAFYYFKI